MKQRSLKKQIIEYGAVSFLATALFIVAAYLLIHFLNIKQAADFQGNKLTAGARKQAEQILPGLLLPEEYGSIDLQLNRIKETEDLSSAAFVKTADSSLSEILKCPKPSERTHVCSSYLKNEILTATEVGLPGSVMGYLIKHKRLTSIRQDNIVMLSLGALFCGIALVFLGLIVAILLFIEKHLRQPLLNLNQSLAPVLEGDQGSHLSPFSVMELQSVATQVEELVRKYQEKKVAAATGELAALVAHDIKSPLASLNSLAKRAAGLSSEDQKLLNFVSERINKIAAGLLERYQSRPVTNNGAQSAFVLSVLERIIAEKQATHRSRGSEIILTIDREAAASFVAVNSTELGRALSNLIENAIEAGSPIVRVFLRRTDDFRVVISVQDEGKGIPPKILARLGQKGVTVNKEAGHGLGLYHARCLVEHAGGLMRIQSEVGRGSTFELVFQPVSIPAWFAGCLGHIGSSHPIIAVDDDPTIHAIWSRILGPRLKQSFSSLSDDLQKQVVEPTVFFLVDNQITPQGPTGIDFIGRNNLAKRSLLVTQDFDNEALQTRCRNIGCRILPKSLLPYLRMNAEETKVHESYDLALIDDDALTRKTWVLRGRDLNMKVAAFKSLDEFRRANVSTKTPIYIDYHLDSGVSGFEVAELLKRDGFQRLSITTADDRIRDIPPYINSVQGKEFPGT